MHLCPPFLTDTTWQLSCLAHCSAEKSEHFGPASLNRHSASSLNVAVPSGPHPLPQALKTQFPSFKFHISTQTVGQILSLQSCEQVLLVSPSSHIPLPQADCWLSPGTPNCPS